MEQKNDAVGWFEVPLENKERAIRFFIADNYGYMALIVDSKGNRIALVSRK